MENEEMDGKLRQITGGTLLTLLFIGCVCASSRTVAQTSVTFTVSSNADDASQTTGGTMYVNDSLMYMSEYTGFRFQNVSIPAGATITSATLDIFSSGSGTASFSVDILAEDVDSASAFSASSNNISGRSRTSAETLWSVNSGSFTDGASFTSPDFSSSIQEVIDRSGWSSGNSLVVITTPTSGDKAVRQRDGGTSYSAQLHITYTTGSVLELHLKLDESGGTAATDSSEYNRDGTVNGTATWTTGARDGAFDFEASDGADRIDAGTWSVSGTALTLAAWVRNESTSNDGRIVIKSSSNSGNDQSWGISLSSGGNPQFRVQAGGTFDWMTSSTSISAGEWTHVAGTYDGTTMRIYINGVLTDSETHNVGGSIAANSGHTVTVGDSTTGSRAFDGALDDIRVYRSTLDADEILALYEGLAGHWTFDDGTGTAIVDSSALANDASFNTGTPTWVSGVRAGALYFDGTNDAISDSSFDPPATGTVAFWFQSAGAPSARQRLWGLGGDFEMWQDPDGLVACDVGGDGLVGGFMTDDPLYTPGRWYHLAAVYDSNDDSYEIYIDGKLHKSGVTTDSIEKQTAAQLSFGTRTGSTERFTGALDDFRIYDYKLSAAEIAELYGLIGHWKLNDATGTIAADESAIGNDGTLNNSPTWTGGVRGGALSFDGSNDYVEVPHDSAFLADEGTVAFWFKANDLSSDQGLFSKDSSGFDTGGHLTISLDNNYIQVRQQSTSASHTITSSSTVATGRWYFVTYQWGTGGMRLLVDGVEVATKSSYTGGLGTSSGGTGNYEPIAIGANTWQSGNLTVSSLNQYFDGDIDDVRLYNLRLSDYHIAELYGLVGHWKFDESSGTTAVDSSAVGADGTHTGGVTTAQAGTRANSVAYDGSTGYTRIPANTAHDATEAVSIAAWIYVDSFGNFENVFGRGDSAHSAYAMRVMADNRIRFRTASAPGQTVPNVNFDSTDTLEVNTWHHVAAIWDGASVHLYIDGQLDSSHAMTGQLGVTTEDSTIGVDLTGADEYFDGRIDDVVLYNRAMTPHEFAEHYGLIAHWKLDELTGTTATDSSGMENHATYVGSPTLGATPSSRAPVGTAVELDGSTQYLTTGVSLMNDLEEFTLAGWIRPDSTSPDRSFFGQNDLIEFGVDYDADQLDVWTSGGGWLAATHTLPLGSWTHVVAIGDGTELTLYINGTLAATGGSSVANYGTNSDTFRIGDGVLDATGDPFDGAMDDIRVYNRAISEDEVQELYFGSGVSGPRIISWQEIANP